MARFTMMNSHYPHSCIVAANSSPHERRKLLNLPARGRDPFAKGADKMHAPHHVAGAGKNFGQIGYLFPAPNFFGFGQPLPLHQQGIDPLGLATLLSVAPTQEPPLNQPSAM